MGLSTSSGTKLPAGAGRTYELIYPQVGQSRITAGAPGTTGTYRPGPTQTAVAAFLVGGTGTQTFSGTFAGAAPIAVACAAAADLSGVKMSFPFYPVLETSGKTRKGDPTHVYRFVVRAAFPALAGAIPAGADLGLELYTANATSIIAGARPGAMFGPTGAAEIGLRVRPLAAGFAVDRRLAVGDAIGVTDYTKMNEYELRLVNSDASGPAQLKAFINGVQFGAPIDCSQAAANFPLITAGGGGFLGYAFGFVNGNPGVAYTCFLEEAHLIVSATEDDAG
jgi:hypothetical protein